MSDPLDHGPDRESASATDPEDPSPSTASDIAPAPIPVENEQAAGKQPGVSSWRAFRDPLLLSILVIALVADQLTKQLVLDNLGIGASWPDHGYFRFTFVRNDGTAFGLFQDNGTLLTFVSLGAVALIVYFYREAAMASWFTRTALGLQLGGAAGNLVDRFRHGFVVDFIDVGPWPIFNVADSAIMTGIIALIAYFTLFGGREQKFGQNSIENNGGKSDAQDSIATPLDSTGFVPPPPPAVDSVSPPETRD